jgi:hypothetical protein
MSPWVVELTLTLIRIVVCPWRWVRRLGTSRGAVALA